MLHHKFSASLLTAATTIALLGQSASAAVFEQRFYNFQGTFSSIVLPINGQQVPTGTIFATQDPTLESIATFDDSDNSTTFDLNFLLDFPLLSNLGLPPVPAPIFETGTYRQDGNDLIANVSGMGVAGGNSPFAGTKTIPTVQWRVTSPLSSLFFEGIIESETVLICPPPGNNCIETIGDGKATRTVKVPEPGALAGMFLLFLWATTVNYARQQISAEKDTQPEQLQDHLTS